jgi:acetyl esterase/lipase
MVGAFHPWVALSRRMARARESQAIAVLTVPDSILIAYMRAARFNRIWVSSDAAERHLADRALRPESFAPPRRLRKDVSLTVERYQGWPLYKIAPAAGPPRGTVIYAHGGGWVNEIAVQHWHLSAQIAARATATVLVPIYPLIPLGDAAQVVGAVTELAAQSLATGPLCLAGDSAGGQIALSAAMLLRDRHSASAARTILISPGLDATLSNPRVSEVEPTDPWLGRPGIRVFAERWRGSLRLEDPLVSPLFGDLRGLGPITLFSGTRDILNPDAQELARRAAAAGIELDYHERPGMVHVYPLLPTAEGRAARRLIIDQTRAAIGVGVSGALGAPA